MMGLGETVAGAMGGMLKALQGEPVVPKIEVAKDELRKALAELEEAMKEEDGPPAPPPEAPKEAEGAP